MAADGLAREVERLPVAPGDPDTFYGALVELLTRNGFPFAGACWHLTDPATGLFTWTGYTGDLPGDFITALHNEYLEDDVAKYADLAARPVPVASLLSETGGRPRRSARYRQQMAPAGFGDELRFAFVDGFGRWGSMGVFAETPFGEAAVDAAAQLVPLVTRALREAVAMAASAPVDGVPGVLMLDPDDRVLMRDERAGELLDGCARTGALPGAVHVLAARARMSGASVRGRTLAGPAWIAIDASPVVDEEGAVAVVLRPAPAPSVLDLRLRAAGLTGREREIALALLRGEDTNTIAASLHLSPWTVQDHLKAIFDKTDVRSRRAFVARWALQSAGAPAV
jgi:DNA-binding CsgD family transcriptional regulator